MPRRRHGGPRPGAPALKRLALAVALLIGLATPSQADFQGGVDAYLRGDDATALQEFKPLAAQGDALAQFSLGVMYRQGQGVPQDYVQAHVWYNLAALRSEPGADQDISVKNRDIIAARMTPPQIAEAQRLAREWKPKREGTATP